MQQTLKEKIQAKLKNSEGFTLLEILVVLTIMGFLIAMVAPRLAGISGGAVDTVCDSNQNRMISMMSGFWEKTNRYPNKMTNIVEETADNAYQIPSISDDDPENGPETLASEFNSRNHFRIHYLNAAEIAELKTLGITTVFNLNSYEAYDTAGDMRTNYPGNAANAAALGLTNPNDVDLAATVTKAPSMETWTLNADVAAEQIAVAMIGMGAEDETDNPDWAIEAGERGWGENDFHGRIVLGFGPENSLVTSGLVSNAAHCPGGIQNADNVTYNDYNLVLPRLESTVDRMYTAAGALNVAGFTDANATEDGYQFNTVSYDEAPAALYDFGAAANTLKTRTVSLTAQEKFQYGTMCPEGHKFPADDGEFWGISISGDTILN